MIVTLSDLKTRAKDRADMLNSNFVQNYEWNTYINSAIADLHDMLIECYGDDYYVKSVNFNTVADQDQYALSTVVTDLDFYKLRGIDARLGNSEYYALSRFNFNERNLQAQSIVWENSINPEIRYRIVGSNIIFSPAPKSPVEIRLWYVPTAIQLVDDADTIDDINGYAEYIVVHAARKALLKEETDTTNLDQELLYLKDRISKVAKNRDIENADSVQDIYASNVLGIYNRFF